MKRLNYKLAFAIAAVLLLAVAIFLNGILGELPRRARGSHRGPAVHPVDSAKDILSRLSVPVQ